jgi:hypothetical protein
MDTETKEDGRPLSSSHRELSADGKILTGTLTRIHPDGSRETKKFVYDRVSKSAGFAGAWRNEIEFDQKSQTMVTTLDGPTLRIAFPLSNQYTDMRLDGTDATLHDPSSHTRVTFSVKSNGALQLITTKKVNGAIVSEGTLTLSEDGHTLVEEWWGPGNPAVKGHKVYEKR